MKHNDSIGYDAENSIYSAYTESYDIGIIYEIFDYEVIILNSKGQFVLIRRRDQMQIGHTVKYKHSDVLKHGRLSKFFPFLSAAAAVLIAALVLFKVFSPFGSSIYGYIDVDVNPSTRFEFDKDLKVINIVNLNNDSTKVINKLDLCGRPLDEALGDYMEKLISEGIIDKKADNFVLFSAALNNDADKKTVDSLLSDSRKKVNGIAKSRKLKIRSEVLSLTPEVKKASSEYKMSIGKYYLYLKARESGSPLNIDLLKDIPVYHLAQLAGLFDTEKNDDFTSSKSNKNALSSVQPPNKAATANPAVTIKPATALKAISPTPKGTHAFNANTPVVKNTEPQNHITSTPIKGQDINVTPVPSKSSTIKSSPSKGTANSLKLEFYNKDKLKRTQGISLDLKITNTGSNEIDLKDLKVRYYFSKEEESKPIYSSYFYSHGEKSGVHGKFVSSPSKEGNEYYLEISFDTGTLLPGKEVYAFGAITKEDWGYFDQENDYSFDAKNSIFAVWDKITVYISGTLAWGKEPY
jgi:hypothetical protein